ncbi:hypothetical protein [Sinomonas mesophila]|uniref:hypothetical protein n=1 Tax=Sinomonas mesophila TaxID=1531955 RepID=UPI0009878419|nr:hypothetical protein [Sinomonas mesophila]
MDITHGTTAGAQALISAHHARSRIRIAAGVVAIVTATIDLLLWLGITIGSTRRHDLAEQGADAALWILFLGGATTLAGGIVLLCLSRRRGGPVPGAIAASVLATMVGAVIAHGLGIFSFQTPGGTLLAVLSVATLAMAALVTTLERRPSPENAA